MYHVDKVTNQPGQPLGIAGILCGVHGFQAGFPAAQPQADVRNTVQGFRSQHSVTLYGSLAPGLGDLDKTIEEQRVREEHTEKQAILFFIFLTYFFYWKIRVAEKRKKKFQLQVYSPDGCNNQAWAGLKPGVSYMGVGAQVLVPFFPYPQLLSQVHLQGSWTGNGTASAYII